MLGNFQIRKQVSEDTTFATDAAGRFVVLKRLPPDCLLEDQLNPTVADRLRRVREIAMTEVAMLRGVERNRGEAYLVWDYTDGTQFNAYATDPSRTAEQVVTLIRDLIQVIEHFHSTGLVHGALHGGNILVDNCGRIWLTDISPLLHLDAQRDERAVVELCRSIVASRGENGGLLDNAICAVQNQPAPIQALAARLSAADGDQIVSPVVTPRVHARRRTLLAAMMLLIIGVVLVLAIVNVVRKGRPNPVSPPIHTDQ